MQMKCYEILSKIHFLSVRDIVAMVCYDRLAKLGIFGEREKYWEFI